MGHSKSSVHKEIYSITGLSQEARALDGVAQWIECQPENQRVNSSIPRQGTCLGFRPDPWLGGCERQPINVSLTHQCVSLPLFLPPFPSF